MAEIKDEVLNTQDQVEVEAEVTNATDEPVSEPAPESKRSNSFNAKLKEWFRKKIVTLKRKPQKISFFFYAISTIFFLVSLFTFSQASSAVASAATGNGLVIFIDTLLSILVLVSFLNTFPNRKKVVIPMLVLVFVMSAAIIACDISVFVLIQNAINKATRPYKEPSVKGSLPLFIVHIILMAISVALLALTPIIRKLLNKINTSVVVESSNLSKGEDIIIDD